MSVKTYRTVADLIAALQELPPEMVPMTREPPFTGVRLYVQDSGKVLFGAPDRNECTPWSGDELDGGEYNWGIPVGKEVW